MEVADYNFDKINSFIAQASDSALCDSNCQKQRVSDKLQQRYLDATANMESAPQQVESAFKKYVTFSRGSDAYKAELLKRVTDKARATQQAALDVFADSVSSVEQSIQSYQMVFTNYNHVRELHTRLAAKNKQTRAKLKTVNSNSLVNDRKTYYEDQQLDTLKMYGTFLTYLYGLITLGFVVWFILGFVKTREMHKDLLAWSIVLIIYPFISMRLYTFFWRILTAIYNIIPKNVARDNV
jgi:hypothetical protein